MDACYKLTWPVSSVFLAEAWTVLYGLRFAAELGFHHLFLESDSCTIINKLNNSQKDHSKISAVIGETKNMASNSINAIFNFWEGRVIIWLTWLLEKVCGLGKISIG